MGEDLPIINFSTSKYVDAKTLSKIRSHAQQRVQDQRLARRTTSEEDDVSGDSAARTSRDVVRRGGSGGQQSFTFVLEQQQQSSGQHAAPKTKAAPRRKKKVVRVKQEDDTFVAVKRECHSLSASPSERPDPFGAFPVAVDGEFLELAENYLHNWKWQHPKSVMFSATLSHPVLVHSFLTVAYKVCRNDEYRCLFHENMTLSYIGKGIQQLHTLRASDREALACALTWSIIRLATVKVIEKPTLGINDHPAKQIRCQINEGQLETSINHLNALALISPDMTVWNGHMFGQHFQTTTASLLLANYTQSSRVQNSLHLPFGPMTTPAIYDVEALNYTLPPNSILLSPTLQSFLHPSVADALLALTALYNLSTSPVTSLPHTHTGPQAREAVKISLRLARGSSSSEEIHDNSWRFQFAECARLTGLLFTWSFGRNVDSQKNDSIASARRHNRAFLTPILIECLLEEARGNRAVYDFLLWMLIVCGSTTNMQDDRAYFAGLVREFYPDCGRWEVGHVRSLGTMLPWIEIEDGGERPWEGFWGEVVDPDGAAASGGKNESGERAPLLLGYVGITPGLREQYRLGPRRGRVEVDVDED